MFLASGWGVAPRADEGGGGGFNSAWGVGAVVGGGQQWRGLQPQRTALHTISISQVKQFELKQS